MEKKPEFDDFARSYDEILTEGVSMSGFAPGYFDEYKIREMHDALKAAGICDQPLHILNFGCGVGNSERYMVKYFPRSSVYSVDVSPESVAIATEKNRDLDNVCYSSFDGLHIPFGTQFDIIFVACVMHHIGREQHGDVVGEMYRRLAPGGHLFIFEHNPYNPLTARIVRACPLDRNAVLLTPAYLNRLLSTFGFAWRRVRYIVFFPHLLRFLLPLERYLRRVPVGAQYYVMAKKAPR